MKCPYCNCEINDSDDFCPNCGQKINEVLENDTKFWENRNINEEAFKREIENKKGEIKRYNEDRKKYALIVSAGIFILVMVLVFFFKIRPSNIYSKGEKYLENHQYEEAEIQFEKLNEEYKNTKYNLLECKYGEAKDLYDNGSYREAMEMFKNIISHKRSLKYYEASFYEIVKQAQIGDTVVGGNYSGSEISWDVIDKDRDTVLLIASNVIEVKPFTEDWKSWRDSETREWLNSDFIKHVFHYQVSKNLCINVLYTDVWEILKKDDIFAYRELANLESEDKVYLPSKSDVSKYNLKPVKRMDLDTTEGFWLRDSSDESKSDHWYLSKEGRLKTVDTYLESRGIRPIIRININENNKDLKYYTDKVRHENITKELDINGYIIPESNKEYLDEEDIRDLSLQEINYAKNEIYARHGRKFKSSELQRYFDKQEWYNGKYEADDFDSNYSANLLNEYEKKNAEVLSDYEFSVDSNGYKLDE